MWAEGVRSRRRVRSGGAFACEGECEGECEGITYTSRGRSTAVERGKRGQSEPLLAASWNAGSGRSWRNALRHTLRNVICPLRTGARLARRVDEKHGRIWQPGHACVGAPHLLAHLASQALGRP